MLANNGIQKADVVDAVIPSTDEKAAADDAEMNSCLLIRNRESIITMVIMKIRVSLTLGIHTHMVGHP